MSSRVPGGAPAALSIPEPRHDHIVHRRRDGGHFRQAGPPRHAEDREQTQASGGELATNLLHLADAAVERPVQHVENQVAAAAVVADDGGGQGEASTACWRRPTAARPQPSPSFYAGRRARRTVLHVALAGRRPQGAGADHRDGRVAAD